MVVPFERLDSAKELQARLKPLIRKTQPYSKRIAHRGIWAEAVAARRDRVPGEVGRRQGAPSGLQGPAGGFVTRSGP